MFDTNGFSSSNITHAPGTAQVLVTEAGTYALEFSVTGVEPDQFAVFVNGAPVPGGVFGSGAGTQQNAGKVIVSLAAGDVVTLRNHTSVAAVTLQTLAGGTQLNVNASMLIERLDDVVQIG